MPTYQITAPNGKTYRIDGPEGATDEQIRAEVVRQFPDADPTLKQFPDTVRGPDIQPQGPSVLGVPVGGKKEFMAGVGDVAQSMGDIVGLVGNPLNAGINAVAGTNLSTDLGETLRTDILGIPHGNKAQETINRFGAAALTGSLGARGAATLANPGTARNVLQTLGRAPLRDTAAGLASGAGAVIGRATGVPGGELVGALVGGVGGYGGVNALAKTGAPRALNSVGQAAERQHVRLLPADTGGPVAKAVTTGTKASPLSVGPVVKAAKAGQEDLRSAATRAAQGQGDATTTTDIVGRGVRDAAKRYTKETAQRGERLYTKAGELAQGTVIKPEQTIAKLDEQIARVKNNPAAPESAAAELQSFRDKIVEGVNVEGLRDARTTLSQGVYDGKLRSGQDKAMWKNILGSLSEDIHSGLVKAGKAEAAAKFKAADTFWKGRVEHIDQVLEPLLGKDGMKSGEDVVKAVETMARGGQGGNARLSRLLANMKTQEAGNLRAIIIDRIGRANPGAQTADGDAFAASTFLTNWNKMTPQAKASLFADKGLRRDLNDIALLAEKMKASQAMANHSNTAIGIGANIGVQAPLAAAHPVGALLGAAGQYLTGRLMASARFARILATDAKLPPEVASRRLPEQLANLATKEPQLASDVARLQAGVNDNPALMGNVAAQPDNQQQQ